MGSPSCGFWQWKMGLKLHLMYLLNYTTSNELAEAYNRLDPDQQK